MIVFNELALSDERDVLNIDVSIEHTTAYPNHFISDIYLEYCTNRNVSGAPSDKALHLFQNDVTSVKSKALDVTTNDLIGWNTGIRQFKGGLFYIIVICKDATDLDGIQTADMGCVLDWQAVYEIGMRAIADYSKKCGKNCNEPYYFKEFIMVFHALELAIDARDLDMMDRLWGRFIAFSTPGNVYYPCNCQ